MQKKIAIIEIQQETNSFSPVLTTLEDFKAAALGYGEDVLAISDIHSTKQIAGFLKAVRTYGKGQIGVVPVITAWSTSGGPVAMQVYQGFKAHVLTTLQQNPALDGIFLSMHGAMGVEGMRDPESDMLQAIRQVCGEQIPIGVAFDLHANVTAETVRQATFITAYRTNPHRDHFQTGFRTGKILIETIQGKVKPVMAFRKLRLLKGGGFTIDFLSPMRKIFQWMKMMEKKPDVLSISTFMVHIWLDDPELGWSTVVVTDGKRKLAEELAETLADMNWQVRHITHPQPVSPAMAIEKVKKSWFARLWGTTILCDVSDIVSAGAPGENTWLLQTIVQLAPHLRAYIPLRDAQMVEVAFDSKLHEEIEVRVGAKLDQVYNQPYTFKGEVIFKQHRQDTGKTAVLKNRGTHLILTERPVAAFFPKFFTELGLNVWKADIVVVKNLFPFRYFFLLYNRKTINVVSAGTTNLDVFQLTYRQISRPIYPLDKIESWK
ncbi:M81 family metallopeptidase [Rhodocytophaga aerolata]|uniref:M81 family metallopeptidase n=1 Tax=Rhodocytophaga aerolata TaxID=455078 RepID=A0ABT8RBM2_9BACT|nr:M81 family metallopeptidase [Rhodocytophaga aerolata]MDO1449507.1 M81 family metallopeptidase [Rhodocytophaga aerolata]